MKNVVGAATRRNSVSKNLSKKQARKSQPKLRQHPDAVAHVEMVDGIVGVLSNYGMADLLVLQERVATAILAKMAEAN